MNDPKSQMEKVLENVKGKHSVRTNGVYRTIFLELDSDR